MLRERIVHTMGIRMTRLTTLIGCASLALGLLIGCSQGTGAANPAEFYKGKTLTFVVPSSAGGATDLYARVAATHLSKQIGATVKVENVAPDEGANYVYNEAKRDGLTFVVPPTSAVISNDILKAPGANYETDKFNFISDIGPTGKIFQISPKIPYKTLEALLKAKDLKGGGTSAKGSLAIGSAVMIEILGLDAKVITGYGGVGDLTMAMGRGEIDFRVTSDNSAKKDEEDGNIVNLFATSKVRSQALPNVPTLFDLGVKVSDDLEAARAYIDNNGTAVALPPEVPKDRVDFMRDAFTKLGENKELQNEIEKMTGFWRPFTPGKELQDTMNMMKANKGLAGQLDAIFAKHKATQ